jgi:hypothetical protein
MRAVVHAYALQRRLAQRGGSPMSRVRSALEPSMPDLDLVTFSGTLGGVLTLVPAR